MSIQSQESSTEVQNKMADMEEQHKVGVDCVAVEMTQLVVMGTCYRRGTRHGYKCVALHIGGQIFNYFLSGVLRLDIRRNLLIQGAKLLVISK